MQGEIERIFEKLKNYLTLTLWRANHMTYTIKQIILHIFHLTPHAIKMASLVSLLWPPEKVASSGSDQKC